MDNFDVMDDGLNEVNKVLQDNSAPNFALGMKLFGGISSTDFWGIVQTDLHKKTLAVDVANLQIAQSNNHLLRQNNLILGEVLSMMQESTSQLYTINYQLEQLSNIIARKAEAEERENFAREFIYNINKMDAALASNTDKSFVSFEADSLLYLIEKNDISTASFAQIQDKEYFEKIVENLRSKVEDITSTEARDLGCFLSLYSYGNVSFR